jgi:mannose-1-phosphate guanylyltransferase
VILLTSYLAETFQDSVRIGHERGMVVEVTHETEPLGTAGAIKNAEELIGDDTFFAFNGDVLTDMDLGQMLKFHREREAEATIVLTPVDDPSAYGVVPTEDDGKVLGFIEKPPAGEAPTNLINAGVYIFEPSILKRIPAGREWSAERALFPSLVGEGARLYATGTDAYWMDIGTPAKYLAANLDALTGRYVTDAVRESGESASVIGAGAAIDPAATVTSSSIGPGCTVATGAVVERSVLLPGARVGAGARVDGCILGEGAEAAPGMQITGLTLGDGEMAQGEQEA